jgi:uncharacterized RDD family membrane protein YckC
MSALPDPAFEPQYYSALLPKRFLAWCVDLVLTLVLVTGLLLLTLLLTVFILPVIWMAVSLAYRTVSLARCGATPGMMLAGIKLRRLDGRRADTTTCFWHALIFSGSMTLVVPQVLSVALMLLTPYRQGLNDVILGTTVLNRYLEH